MSIVTQHECHNLLLRSLPADQFAMLAGSMELVSAARGDCFCEPGEQIKFVYFPETGVISITSEGTPMRLELGLIGREGFAGIPAIMCDGICPANTAVQVAGTFLRVRADMFRAAVHASPMMLATILRYVQSFMVQLSSTAVANGSFNVEQRLARWLLMVHDRLDNDQLALTHDLISMMLGVRRPGVTVATHVLEGEHAIRASRGRVEVRDREKLIGLAGGSYGLAEAEYERLMGMSVRGQRAAPAHLVARAGAPPSSAVAASPA